MPNVGLKPNCDEAGWEIPLPHHLMDLLIILLFGCRSPINVLLGCWSFYKSDQVHSWGRVKKNASFEVIVIQDKWITRGVVNYKFGISKSFVS